MEALCYRTMGLAETSYSVFSPFDLPGQIVMQ